MLCSICFEEIPVNKGWEHGNNAEPVNMGRCCNRCDNEIVIPARLRLMSVSSEVYFNMLVEQHTALSSVVGAAAN